MHAAARYVALLLAAIIALHYLVAYSNPAYSDATSIESINQQWRHYRTANRPDYALNRHIPPSAAGGRANATFVVLARNQDLHTLLWSMRSVENTFNDKPENRYPWVFLNDEPFTEHFKKHTRAITKAPVYYGQVDPEEWNLPPWIDRPLAEKKWSDMQKAHMIYGGSESYRKMCRYQSGYFFRHKLLQEFDYYWRVEPNVRYYCDLDDFDPFMYMKENKKKYGWVISLHEYPMTIRTLWIETRKWMDSHRHMIPANNSLSFVTDDGIGYNKCHFWSNFEIGDLNFFRSPEYLSYFNHLDQAGGFFYERWGDAPIHSIAAAMLLAKEEIHFFDNIGYRHDPFQHCPTDPKYASKCACDPLQTWDYDPSHFSCMYNWDKLWGRTSPDPSNKKLQMNAAG